MQDLGLLIFTGLLVLAIVLIAAAIIKAVNWGTARRSRRLGIKPPANSKEKRSFPTLWFALITIIFIIILANHPGPPKQRRPIHRVEPTLPPYVAIPIVVGMFVALIAAWWASQYLRLRLRYHDKAVDRSWKRAESGDVEGAITDLRAEIDAKGPSANRAHGLGMLYAKQERWAEAYDCFVEAVRLGKDQSHSLLSQASCLAKLGREEEAVTVMEEACSLEAGSPDFRYVFCQLLVDLGRFDEAREQFRLGEELRAKIIVLSSKPTEIDELRKRLESALAGKTKDRSGFDDL